MGKKLLAIYSIFVLASMLTVNLAQAQTGCSFGAAAPPWGLDPNTGIVKKGVFAATCGVLANAPDSMKYTMGLLDLSNPPAPSSSTWTIYQPPMYHHPSWSINCLGNVFGLTFDCDGNLYTAASIMYRDQWSGGPVYTVRYGDIGGGADDLGAAGTVYKIDKNTGQASVFVQLPQQLTTIQYLDHIIPVNRSTGPGLGDLAFAAKYNQFYISNMEDGKIYRYSPSGTLLGTYDPRYPDNGAAGFPADSEKVFAVKVYQNKLYYSMWYQPWRPDTNLTYSYIRSVDLDASGVPIAGTDVFVWQLPNENSNAIPSNYDYVAISDISFSSTGKMLVALRTFFPLNPSNQFVPTMSYNHEGKVYIVEKVAGTWTTQNTIAPGNNKNEGYGGADWGYGGSTPEAFIWTSSADMFNPDGPHGIQGWPVANTPINGRVGVFGQNYLMIPYDPTITAPLPNNSQDNKGTGGDIEGFGGDLEQGLCVSPCSISAVTAVPGACVPATNKYSLTGSVTFANAPATGKLVVKVGSDSVEFNAPFTSPQAYTISNLVSDGASHTATAYFTADAACTLNQAYTAPASCGTTPCGTPNCGSVTKAIKRK